MQKLASILSIAAVSFMAKQSLVTAAMPLTVNQPLVIRSNFSGGSAKVNEINQDARTIYFQSDSDKDRGVVAWWYFKVEGITPGEVLTLKLSGGAWAKPRRAAMSLDNNTWRQTPPATREGKLTVYRVKVDSSEAWFAWGPPFLLKQAQTLVNNAVSKSPHVYAFTLATSVAGHPVPALRISYPGAEGKSRRGVWIHARLHAWEAGGSWTVQGLVNWLLSDVQEAITLRAKADFYIVPIMDVDNVQSGNGGKGQAGGDYNRVWGDDAYWPEVKAAMQNIRSLTDKGQFDLFIDVHDPTNSEEQPFFVYKLKPEISEQRDKNMNRFLDCAMQEIVGPLQLAREPYHPWYKREKTEKEIEKESREMTSSSWVVQSTPDHVVACTFEVPWNTPYGTVGGYAIIGRQLGLTVADYFQGENRN